MKNKFSEYYVYKMNLTTKKYIYFITNREMSERNIGPLDAWNITAKHQSGQPVNCHIEPVSPAYNSS